MSHQNPHQQEENGLHAPANTGKDDDANKDVKAVPIAVLNTSSLTSNSTTTMADDASHDDTDMLAPQISTLREDMTPPPAPPADSETLSKPSAGETAIEIRPSSRPQQSKFRINLKVSEPHSSSASAAGRKTPPSSRQRKDHQQLNDSDDQDEDDDELDEEDQLADDDDVPSVAASSVVGTPRGRGSRGGRGRGGGRGKGRGRGAAAMASASASEPPQTVFEVTGGTGPGRSSAYDTGDAGSGTPVPSGKPPRKKAKKSEKEKKPKISIKARYVPVFITVLSHSLTVFVAILSERRKLLLKYKMMQLVFLNVSLRNNSVDCGAKFFFLSFFVNPAFGGTAASSPMMRPELDTPDIEPIALESSTGPVHAATANITTNGASDGAPFLDPSAPIPVYRLPAKPFLVQPLPKVAAGFAPMLTVDRNRAPVRRWRTAQRAIRGIAGGQWFVKTWIGEKESPYASTLGAHNAIQQGQNASAPPGVLPLRPGDSTEGGGPYTNSGGPAWEKIKGFTPTAGSGRGSISVPGVSGRGRKRGGGAMSSTAASSRAGSVDAVGIPEVPAVPALAPSTTRTPSKMRHILSAQDAEIVQDAEDVEMAVEPAQA